jgi:hypothetical protein
LIHTVTSDKVLDVCIENSGNLSSVAFSLFQPPAA